MHASDAGIFGLYQRCSSKASFCLQVLTPASILDYIFWYRAHCQLAKISLFPSFNFDAALKYVCTFWPVGHLGLYFQWNIFVCPYNSFKLLIQGRGLQENLDSVQNFANSKHLNRTKPGSTTSMYICDDLIDIWYLDDEDNYLFCRRMSPFASM